MLQVKYNKEIYEIETIFVYDGYISLYKGELNVNGSFTVKLNEVKILFDDYSDEQDDIIKFEELEFKKVVKQNTQINHLKNESTKKRDEIYKKYY